MDCPNGVLKFASTVLSVTSSNTIGCAFGCDPRYCSATDSSLALRWRRPPCVSGFFTGCLSDNNQPAKSDASRKAKNSDQKPLADLLFKRILTRLFFHFELESKWLIGESCKNSTRKYATPLSVSTSSLECWRPPPMIRQQGLMKISAARAKQHSVAAGRPRLGRG